jgi:uncharacterized membrane protein
MGEESKEDVPELTIDELTNAIANLTTELIKTNTIAVDAHNQTQYVIQALVNSQEKFKAISRIIGEQQEGIERLDAAYDVIKSYIKGVPQ